MSKSKKVNIQEEFFKSATKNALDFLETSVKQLETSPKQSLINFAAAIEIILKARLILEHWSLVTEKPEAVTIEKFRGGIFKTVTSDGAIQRLENIAGESFFKHEKEAFTKIAKHRNRLLHFFHPDYETHKEWAIQQVVSEQIQAWFYLHRLLTQRWKEYFSKFSKSISKIDRLIKKNKKYLDSKFNALKPEIDEYKKKKGDIAKCNRCGFTASRVEEIEEPLFTKSCLVCEFRQNLLRVECPDCKKSIVEIEDVGEGLCECGYKVTLEKLLQIYGPVAKKETGTIYCGTCGIFGKSVIEFSDGYLCLNCLEFDTSADQCEWCGEWLMNFDAEDSYANGCGLCQGWYPSE